MPWSNALSPQSYATLPITSTSVRVYSSFAVRMQFPVGNPYTRFCRMRTCEPRLQMPSSFTPDMSNPTMST